MAELPRTEWVTLRQAAELTGLAKRTLHKAVFTHKLAGFRLGALWCVYLDDIPIWRESVVLEKRKRAQRMVAIWNDEKRTTPKPMTCPTCGLLTDDGGLCEFCRDDEAGLPYWAHRDVSASVSSSFARANLRVRLR